MKLDCETNPAFLNLAKDVFLAGNSKQTIMTRAQENHDRGCHDYHDRGCHDQGSAPRRFYRKTAGGKTAFAVAVTVLKTSDL